MTSAVVQASPQAKIRSEKYILRNILWTIIDVMMFIEVTVIHFIREVLGEMEMEVQKIDLRGTK